MRAPIRVLIPLVALTFIAWGVHAAVKPMGGDAHPAPVVDDARRGEIADLDAKIKQLRQEFRAEVDPLQAQVKAVRDKYEPQIKSLEDQRKALAEESKLPKIQQIDREEDADLAALADREKAEVEKVKARFAEERKTIQQRYDEERKEAHASGK
jgi:hypothetical protein